MRLSKKDNAIEVAFYCKNYDQEILIYGGRFLKDLGDLSNLQPSTLLISPAVNLTKITCHSPNLTTTDFSTCTKLQEIDLSDCTKLGSGIGTSSTLNIAACTNLRSVNAFNTQLTAILTNLSGGNVEEIRFPYSVQTITVKNQPLLRSLGIPVYYTGRLTDSNNRFVERLVSVDIANCERLESLVTNYCEVDGVPVEVPAFLGVKYGQTFSISNSLTFLERLDLSHCANLRSLSLGDFTRLKELNIDDITSWDATSSNLGQLTLINCPNVETVTFNQNTLDGENSLGVAFKEGTTLDLSGLTHLKHVRSNVGVKGLKNLLLPTSVVSLVFDFPKDTTYSQPFSDIENIWSRSADHSSDGFKGIDLLDMDTITDFSMGSLNLVENAINLNIKITKTFPYFNYHKTSNFFQPTGIVDISDYEDSLAYLFKGVNLDQLIIVCNKPLTQSNASYMFAYASCSNAETIPQLFTFLRNTTDLSYMFYHASILHAPILPATTTDCRYMFYNCSSMTSTPSNWLNEYNRTPVSDYCYTGCTGIVEIDGQPGILDNIPVRWGGYERQNSPYGGESITANNTLDREITSFKAKGRTLRNIVTEVAQTPTLMSQSSSQALRSGLDEHILTIDGNMPKAELEGITLVNLASEKRSGYLSCNKTTNDIRKELNQAFKINDGAPFHAVTLEGLTLTNLIPEQGKTPEITNNDGSFEIGKNLDDNIVIKKGKMESAIIYGKTLTNSVNKDTSPLYTNDYQGTVKLYEGSDFELITDNYTFESATIYGRTLINLLNSTHFVTTSCTNPSHKGNGLYTADLGDWFNFGFEVPTIIGQKYIFHIKSANTTNGTIFVNETNYYGKGITSFNTNSIKYAIFTATTSVTFIGFGGGGLSNPTIDTPILMDYQDGIENWNWDEIPYFEDMQSVKMSSLMTANQDNILGKCSISVGGAYGGYIKKLTDTTGEFKVTNSSQDVKINFGGVNTIIGRDNWCYVTVRFGEDMSNVNFNKVRGWTLLKDNRTLVFKELTYGGGGIGGLVMSNGSGLVLNQLYTFEVIAIIPISSAWTFDDYVPYKTNTLSCNEEVVLRRIKETSYDTTEIRDELDLVNGIYTKKLTEVKITDDMLYVVSENDEMIVFGLKWSKLPDIKVEGNMGNGTKVLCNLLQHIYVEGKQGIFAHGMRGEFQLTISKTSSISTEAQIRQWFKDNDLTIIYQLTTPITKKIDLSIVDQDENTLSSMNYFEDGYISIDTETGIIPKLDYTVHSSNYFELSNVRANNNYTLRYDGEPTSMTICGNEITPMNDSIINNSSVKNNILTTNRGVSNLMLINGDVTNEDIEYFKGTRSVEALEVAVYGGVNQPVFGKGGRK